MSTSRPRRLRLSQRIAVVTGGANGIGRGIALALARRGCHLVLADIDEHGLRETAELAASKNVRVSVHRLDVADREAVAEFPRIVRESHHHIDLLVNNAGVMLSGVFEEISEVDFEWLIEINFLGLVRMTRAFLPLLKLSDDARVVNLSSIFGLIAPPEQSAYAASKFAVRAFSHSLSFELKDTSVGVTVVHPGGVATGIVGRGRVPSAWSDERANEHRARAEGLLKMSAVDVGEAIVSAVECRKARVIIGADARVLSLLERIAPVGYLSVLALLFGGRGT